MLDLDCEKLDIYMQLPISWLLDFPYEFQNRFSYVAIGNKDYYTIYWINCGALGFAFLFSFPMECTIYRNNICNYSTRITWTFTTRRSSDTDTELKKYTHT